MELKPVMSGPVLELAIIIVNYRTPALVLQCLQSLFQEKAENSFRVIVVDNDSGDGSADQIAKDILSNQWQDWVQLVRSDINKGFSGGNNLGLALAKETPYVLLLNSDTIVHPGCLARCIEVMKANPSIGALSCKLLNADGSIQNVARKFPNPLFVTLSALGLTFRWPNLFRWANIQDPNWDRATECRPVGWLGGAFLMVPQAVLNRVGRLDEDFFFYGEDVEFCHRVHRAGYVRWYEASVAAIHLGAGSSDVTRLPRDQRSAHRVRARYLEQRKLYGRWAEWLVRGVDTAVDGLRAIKNAVIKRK